MRTYTTHTPYTRPRVTAVAAAMIRAYRAKGIKPLHCTAVAYGHSNREIIGRVDLDRLADIR